MNREPVAGGSRRPGSRLLLIDFRGLGWPNATNPAQSAKPRLTSKEICLTIMLSNTVYRHFNAVFSPGRAASRKADHSSKGPGRLLLPLHRLGKCMALVQLIWAAPAFAAAPQTDAVIQADIVIYAAEALLVPGEPTVANVAISVVNERISAVDYPAFPPAEPDAAGSTVKIIDLSCCFLLPGLIDTQTHLQSQLGMPPRLQRLTSWTDADYALHALVHARRTLLAGFTTVRDMGSSGDGMFALRDAINRGLLVGPRIQVAGEIIMPTGGELRGWLRSDVEQLFQTSAICDGADDCRRAVRDQVARGSDTLKVATAQALVDGSPSMLTFEELIAIRQEAHRLGVRVTASAFSVDSINLPLQAGFDAVVHSTFANDETLKLLRSSSAYFIPTLVAARTVKEMAEDADAPFSDAWRRENLDIYHGMVASFQQVRQAGLKIAFGTDAGWRPHGGNAEQLVQMAELGMANADVIVTATVHAADAIGWADRVGTLEVGKFADMVAVANSPLKDISELTRPLRVIKAGQVIEEPN